jgi:DNA phosphorothioation-dependent restriction protein DptG
MKDILNKLEESIKSTVKEAMVQSQKSVDQTVCRTELISKNNELKKLYQQLGMAKYENRTGGNEEAIHAPLYSKIDSLIKEINEIEKEVKDIVNTQKDSFDTYKRKVKTTWNENMAKEVKPEPGPDGVEIMKICDYCNTGNHVEASFCISCGKKI